MLKNWSIQNFKPILSSGDLNLAPITVLAGLNSSGKSSLIQSILMIAQTLSSRILDRALLPNGPIVQLGTFEDILSEQTKLRTLLVSFKLEIEKEELKLPINAFVRTSSGRAPRLGSRSNIKTIEVTAQFRSASTNGTSASAIEASKVNVGSVSMKLIGFFIYRQLHLFSDTSEAEEAPEELNITINPLTTKELEEYLQYVTSEYLRLVPYTEKDQNYLATFGPKNPTLSPSLVAFSHFLPGRFIGKYAVEERRKLRFTRMIESILESPNELAVPKVLTEFIDLEKPLPTNLREAVIAYCKNEHLAEPFSGQSFLELMIWFRSLKSSRKKNVAPKIKDIKDIIVQNVLSITSQENIENNKQTEALEALTNNILVESFEEGIEQIIRFFTSKIRYLGPLRADPQAAQRFAPSSELDDVGAKGEYAAAVYDANQNAPILYYNPFRETTERSTLKVALDIWVSYLGVANEVKIQMAGQSGVSWQVVHMKGHRALPLTAVGVGVSQILPILVMGLLAPSNTLLLVEQPELHLHARIQARLGDFFMGLAKCAKQCIIETHSDNLVSQLRYHIVKADSQEKSDCLIYFVDQDQDGATRFNPIEISPQGQILNWPEGFFDETMLQEDRITAASLKKRATKTENGKHSN